MKNEHPRHPVKSALKRFALALVAGVTLAGSAAHAQLPVIDGLQCWFDASQGVTTSGTAVTSWADQSGNGHTATKTNGSMTLAASQVNGKPVVQFRNRGNATLTGSLFTKQQYVVFRMPNSGDWGTVLGSQSQSGYMFHPSGYMWDGNYPAGVRQNGGTALSPNYQLSNIGNYMVLKIEGNSNDSSVRTGWALGVQQGWNGCDMDVAEIVAFDRVLTTDEENQIGGYLTGKYAIAASSYPALPLQARITSPFDGQQYPNGSSITVSADVIPYSGTGPYTAVKFWLKAAADPDFTQVGSTQSGDGPTFTQALTTADDTSYQIKVEVTDSAGVPATVFSATTNFALMPTVSTSTELSATTPSTYGEAATLTATVAAGSAANGGTVQFYDNLVPLGSPVAINTNTGEASYTTNTLAAGTHPITASYNGYGVYLTSATAASTDQVVDQAVLNVTADNKVRSPGSANPILTYQISGYQLGQTLATSGVSGTATLACAAVPSDPVGNYPITVDISPMTAANYIFNGVAGNLLVVVGAPPTVTGANMACWYDAGQGVTTSGSNVTTWNDSSGNGHNASTASGTVTYLASDTQIAKPAVHLRGSNSFLTCNSTGGMFTKEQYVVVRSPNATWNGSGSFLGRAGPFLTVRQGSYNLFGGQTGFWDDQSPAAVSKNGIAMNPGPGTMDRGSFQLGTITDYMILKIRVNNADAANIAAYPGYFIGKCETLGTASMDIAEIVGYDSALSSADEGAVTAYLATKYSIVMLPSAPTITGITPGDGTLSVAFTAPVSDGGGTITNYKYSTNNGATFTAVSPNATTSPILIGGLTNDTPYPVKILAVNSVGDGPASNSMSGTPAASGAGYDTWAALQSPQLIGGPGYVGSDGIPNLVIYALKDLKTDGTNGSTGTLTGNTLSFEKRQDAITNGDVSWAIETSTTLEPNSWTVQVTQPKGDPTLTISYDLPAGQAKVFARLVVSQ